MIKAVYLSGWEYNRVLQDTPLEPVVSGLPAQVLWDGSAQFWMFETVYCTKEALLGDLAAYEEVGWTTGRIFADLSRRGFLTPVDWAKEAEADVTLKPELESAHHVLKEHYSREQIYSFLETGRDAELEAIKLRLISPLLLRLSCAKNVSPNSIAHWVQDRGDPIERSTPTITTAGDLLSSALFKSCERMRAGFRLCDPPGTGLPVEVIERQRQAELKVQRPLIPDLLAGALPQREYHRQVAANREIYAPFNAQLWASYVRKIDTLERLRDLARIYLWPNLHNEWLPELDRNPDYLPKFRTLITDALHRSQFDPLLQITTDVSIITLGGIAGATAGSLSGQDPISSSIAGSAAAGTVRRVFDVIHGTTRRRSDNLVIFLQKARKAIRQGA